MKRGRALAVCWLLALGVSGCPVTDDYYLLSDGPPGAHGAEQAAAGANGDAAGGSAAGPSRAGSSTGARPSDGGASCVPTTERCNGYDDDCDEIVDELACVTNCSGFVLGDDSERGYMFCTGSRRASWNAATSSCAAQDMRLAWLDSPEKNQAVSAKLSALSYDTEVLFGATDRRREGEWLWYGGAQFWQGGEDGFAVDDAFNAWGVGAPNDSGSNEDCAILYPATASWGDRNCDAFFAYVCEEID